LGGGVKKKWRSIVPEKLDFAIGDRNQIENLLHFGKKAAFFLLL
jgi:hypothetical protein